MSSNYKSFQKCAFGLLILNVLFAAAPVPGNAEDRPFVNKIVLILPLTDLSAARAQIEGGAHVVGIVDAAENLAMMRREAASQGLLNRKLTLIPADECGEGLPLDDRIVDLAVVAEVGRVAAEELRRVLSPGIGRVEVRGDAKALREFANVFDAANATIAGGRLTVERPRQAGADDWTHWFRRPDNNVFSHDKILRFPMIVAWSQPPYLLTRTMNRVAAGGRFFYAVNDDGVPTTFGRCIVARSIFNGHILWRKQVSRQFRVIGQTMIAGTETLTYADGPDVIICEAATGKELRRKNVAGDGRAVKWLAQQGSLLIALSGKADPEGSLDTWMYIPLVKNFFRGERFGDPEIKIGFGDRVEALSGNSLAREWVHDETGEIDSRLIAISPDNQVQFSSLGKRLVGLNLKDGKLLWTNTDEAVVKVVDAAFGDALQVGMRTGLVAGKGASVFCKAFGKPIAVSSTDGKQLWTTGKAEKLNRPWMFIEEGRVVFNQNRWRKDAPPNIRDLLTGQASETSEYKGIGGGCGTFIASKNLWMAQAFSCYDRNTDRRTDLPAKVECRQGWMVADGTAVNVAQFCACGPMRGMFGLRTATEGRPVPPALRLQKGHTPWQAIPAKAGDWEQARGGIARDASSPVRIAAAARLLWQARAPVPSPVIALHGIMTDVNEYPALPPIAVGDAAIVAGSDGVIRCHDAGTGSLRWTFAAGSGLRCIPAADGGQVYVGDLTGRVSCLSLKDGSLVWSRRIEADARPKCFDNRPRRCPDCSGRGWRSGRLRPGRRNRCRPVRKRRKSQMALPGRRTYLSGPGNCRREGHCLHW